MSNIIKQIEWILSCYLSCDRSEKEGESKYKSKKIEGSLSVFEKLSVVYFVYNVYVYVLYLKLL